jgi:hypothetical protein
MFFISKVDALHFDVDPDASLESPQPHPSITTF